MQIIYTNHALEELSNRGIEKNLADEIVNNPQQVIDSDNNRKIYQSIVEFENKKNYVVRIIVEETLNNIKVVTIYKSSKISKYWRNI